MAQAERNSLQRIVRKNVRALRLKLGLSQEQLAEKAGLHSRYISRLETKDQNVTLDILDKLATALGVHPTELLGHRPIDLGHRETKLIDSMIKDLQILRSRI